MAKLILKPDLLRASKNLTIQENRFHSRLDICQKSAVCSVTGTSSHLCPHILAHPPPLGQMGCGPPSASTEDTMVVSLTASSPPKAKVDRPPGVC